MNFFLQVGLGLLPGAILIWIIVLKRHLFGLAPILCGTTLLAASLGCVGQGLLTLPPPQEAKADPMAQEELISLANAMFVEEVYDQAWDTLAEYSDRFGYDDQCRLLAARLSYAQGDTQRGLGLYRYLTANTDLIQADSKEYQQAVCSALYSPSDLAYATYLEDAGLDPAQSGYDATTLANMKEYLDIDLDDIVDEMVSGIQTVYDLKKGADSEFAELCGEFNELYTKYQEDGDAPSKDVKNLLEDLSDLGEEQSALTTTTTYRDMKLKLNVLVENFEDLVADLGADSSYHEVMIATELYLGKEVKDSDFSQNYQKVASADSNAVLDQLDKVYETVQDKLSEAEDIEFQRRVESIHTAVDKPTLSTLKTQLETQAEESHAVADQTKIYLQLAKVEKELEHDVQSDDYLNKAIYSSQASEDADYANAMGQIITVIDDDGSGDLEDIKNVTDYVDAVLDNSLTVDVENIVSTDTKVTEDFQQTVVDYVSRVKTAISIGRIDTEEFEKITAQVQISSDNFTTTKSLQEALRVYDCGVEITDFTLTKLDYTQSNFLLCCDVSGSMDSAIGDLRSAVSTFVEGRGGDEDISVVTFDTSVVGTAPFGSSDEDLLAFAEDMRIAGGTHMFGALTHCLGNFDSEITENSVVILMTDGEDGTYHSTEEIYSTIGSMAEDAGVTVYTMGLGSSVDTSYLSTLADAGGGDFIYVSDSASLDAFFDLLHSQAANQYILEYNAVDTMTASNRDLRLVLEKDNVADTKKYSIGQGDGELDAMHNITVSGLSDRYLYKGNKAVNTTLKGSGFVATDSANLKLSGTMSYRIPLTYTDKETYSLTLPANLAEGTYDVEVTIQGRKCVLVDGFSVLSDKTTTIQFGDYVFKGALRIDNEDMGTTTLRGGVIMNDWLRFKGDVVFTGDLKSDSIQFSDYSGSYVQFNTQTAVGLGSTLAKKGISQDIPALQTFTLHRDGDNTEEIRPGVLPIYQVIYIESPYLELKPHELKVTFTELEPVLPYIEDLLDETEKKNDDDSPFKVGVEDVSASITDKNIGIAFALGYEDTPEDKGDEPSYSHKINLFGHSIPFNGEVKLAIDTIAEEYSIGAKVGMDFMGGDAGGLGAEFTWADGCVDEFKLDIELTSSIQNKLTFYCGTVPISLTEFGVGASDIATAIDQGNLFAVTAIGTFSLEAAKVSAVMPQLEKFVGDVNVLSLPSTEIKLRLDPFRLSANGKLNLFKEITLAEASIDLGTFPYTESLLNMDGETVTGFSSSIKAGFMWELDDGSVYVDVTGTGRLNVHNRFIGMGVKGNFELGVDWWLLNMGHKESGDILMGLYTTSNGRHYWMLTTQIVEKHLMGDDTTKTVTYYIDENGRAGDQKGTLNG